MRVTVKHDEWIRSEQSRNGEIDGWNVLAFYKLLCPDADITSYCDRYDKTGFSTREPFGEEHAKETFISTKRKIKIKILTDWLAWLFGMLAERCHS